MLHCGAGLIKGLCLQFTQMQQNLMFLTQYRYFPLNLGPDSGMSVAILKKGPIFSTRPFVLL